MNEHVEPFIESLRASGKSPNTLTSYRTACRAWVAAGCPPADEWMSHLFDSGKPATANQRRAALMSFHRYLVKRGILEANPFADHDRVVKEPRRTLRVLTIGEVARLIDACECVGENGARLGAMVALIATAGLRVSEVCGLRLADIELEERVARVIGKGDKERMVKFGVVAQEKIRAYLELRPGKESPWLFCASSGAQVDTSHFRKDLEKAAWWADLKDINPHLLRHTFATLSIEARLPIEDVAGMLGHESITTTQQYVHRDNSAAWRDYDSHPLAS